MLFCCKQTFKYLQEKPVDEFKGQGQFLQILDAEAEGLVDINIHVQKEPLRNLTLEFYKVYLTSMDSEEAKAWNRVREDIVVEALAQHLLPLGARWIRDRLKEQEEEEIAMRCAAKLDEVGSSCLIYLPCSERS